MTATVSAPQTSVTTTKQAKAEPAKSTGWRRGFENLSREHGFEPLRVDGKLPADLRGTFYRNGPGKFDVAGERYRHWFDGDGMVVGIRLDGEGGAAGGVKLVATKWREREERAGRRIYGGYDTPMVHPIREIFFGDNKNPANTSVLVHNDRLFALCEGGKPFEISTADLSTIGPSSFDGAVLRAFSAHPHRVPERNATYGFGLGLGKDTKVECHVLPDGEKARRLTTFSIEGQRMNHDFAATSQHLVFFFAPVYFSLWSVLMKRGLVSGSKYREEKGTEIVIVPINEPDAIIRFTVPHFYMEHTVNAFELPSGEIVVDYVHYDHLRDLEDFVSGVSNGSPKRALDSSLRRAIIDPKKKTFRSEPLLDVTVELPRINPRLEGKEHHIAYAVAFDGAAPPTSILKHDMRAKKVEHYKPGADQYPGEAVFVPRGNGGASEDDGWLLALVLDGKSGTSHLEVLDAARISDGPIATCHFDQAIPFGFHGIWDPS